MFCLHVYKCISASCMCHAHGSRKGALDSLELELQRAPSCHMDTGGWIWVLLTAEASPQSLGWVSDAQEFHFGGNLLNFSFGCLRSWCQIQIHKDVPLQVFIILVLIFETLLLWEILKRNKFLYIFCAYMCAQESGPVPSSYAELRWRSAAVDSPFLPRESLGLSSRCQVWQQVPSSLGLLISPCSGFPWLVWRNASWSLDLSAT